MTTVLTLVAILLLLNLLVGTWLIARRDDPLDRIAGSQLIGTLTVALLLVLGQMSGDRSLVLVALALALLGAVTVGALVRSGRPAQ